MNPDKKNLEEKFNLLPEELKNAITSAEVGERVSDIAKKYNLRIDQGGMLDEEILYVMLGITHPDEFTKKIKNRLALDEKMVTALVQDINSEIFLSIRKYLMLLHEKRDSTKIKSEEISPSREEVLNEIENPTQNMPAQKPSTELMIGRLTGIVQIPGGKSQIPLKKPAPSAPPATPTIKPAQEQNKNPERPRSADPYREPLH